MTDPTDASQVAAPVLRALRRTRQVRQFTDEPVTESDLRAILEVARWSGSSTNRQPWTFIVLRSPDVRARLADLAPYARHVGGAPLGIAIAMAGDNPEWDAYDEGRAAERMLVAAGALDLGAGIGWVQEAQRPAVAALLGLTRSRLRAHDHLPGSPDGRRPPAALGAGKGPPTPLGARPGALNSAQVRRTHRAQQQPLAPARSRRSSSPRALRGTARSDRLGTHASQALTVIGPVRSCDCRPPRRVTRIVARGRRLVRSSRDLEPGGAVESPPRCRRRTGHGRDRFGGHRPRGENAHRGAPGAAPN